MTSQEEQPPAILLTDPCFTAPWRDAIDANDNIWTWLGQVIARGVIPWQIDRRVTPHPLENWWNFVDGVILGVDFDFDQLGHVKLTVT